MQEDTHTLDEVVVTALGIKKEKKMLGYSVQEIKGDKLNQTGDPSITGALQGKVAGLANDHIKYRIKWIYQNNHTRQ